MSAAGVDKKSVIHGTNRESVCVLEIVLGDDHVPWIHRAQIFYFMRENVAVDLDALETPDWQFAIFQLNACSESADV